MAPQPAPSRAMLFPISEQRIGIPHRHRRHWSRPLIAVRPMGQKYLAPHTRRLDRCDEQNPFLVGDPVAREKQPVQSPVVCSVSRSAGQSVGLGPTAGRPTLHAATPHPTNPPKFSLAVASAAHVAHRAIHNGRADPILAIAHAAHSKMDS